MVCSTLLPQANTQINYQQACLPFTRLFQPPHSLSSHHVGLSLVHCPRLELLLLSFTCRGPSDDQRRQPVRWCTLRQLLAFCRCFGKRTLWIQWSPRGGGWLVWLQCGRLQEAGMVMDKSTGYVGLLLLASSFFLTELHTNCFFCTRRRDICTDSERRIWAVQFGFGRRNCNATVDSTSGRGAVDNDITRGCNLQFRSCLYSA